ncbi:MAG TPA: hypothetical protein VL461_07625 [Dictyobacter sp.]|nr:hypothetical protein [Dictyobacter sp.]
MKQDQNTSSEGMTARKPSRNWRSGVIPFLLLLCIILVASTVLTLRAWTRTTNAGSAVTQHPTTPLQAPDGQALPPLQLSLTQSLLYEEPQGLFVLPPGQQKAAPLQAPGYQYNRAVSPLALSSDTFLYSGDGIWLANLATHQFTRVEALPAGQVVTSMVVSQDKKVLAWSTEPLDGSGKAIVYAGAIGKTKPVYQTTSGQCPCFRAFSFAQQSDTMLYLTNDRGDHRTAAFGLWSLDLSAGKQAQPQNILADQGLQVPLALAPTSNQLLYSTFAGYVPVPMNGSTPADISSVNYANSLLLASIQSVDNQLVSPQTILPVQQNVKDTSDYKWVNTPEFSPDGADLLYVGFTSNSQSPFVRQNALYLVPLHAQQGQEQPQLLATTTAGYVELGAWLSPSVVTFYANDALYALDVTDGAVTQIVQTGSYARSIAALG